MTKKEKIEFAIQIIKDDTCLQLQKTGTIKCHTCSSCPFDSYCVGGNFSNEAAKKYIKELL